MKKIVLLMILLFVAYAVKAQKEIVAQNIVLPVPIIDSSKIDSFSNICGVIRDMELNCLDKEFAQTENNIWRKLIKIQSNGAKEIKIVFQKFILSNNAIVSFYTDDSLRYQYQGAYFIHKPDSSYISNFLHGDHCSIIIEIPMDELYKNQILISKIYHFTESFNEAIKAATADYSCMIDINCSEGNNWCDQKRSVALYYFPKEGGWIGQCTGALVNNYRNNFVQYFLTARHCTDEVIDWSLTEFYFNYQNSFCNGEDGYLYDYYRVQGSQLVGYCDISWSDNALLLITEPIPIQYNVYYAGVDITNRSAGDEVTCIHHSDGNPKKITSGKIKYFAGPKWDVYWDDGIIMGGGSGAPVFLNSKKRIIATISGGMNYHCNSSLIHDWVGKIKSCMSHSDAMREALFGNTDIVSYEGIDPIRACQSNLNLSGIFSSTHFYDLNLNELTIQANNNIEISSAVFENEANYNFTAGNQIVFSPNTHIQNGANITAKIRPCSGNLVFCGTHYSSGEKALTSTSIGKYDESNMEKQLTIFPNPVNNELTIDNGQCLIKEVYVYDVVGKTIKVFTVNNTNSTLDIGDISKGIYLIKIKTENEIITKKIVKE
ncbi:MAG: T9SS type A sorting domain-containing protein [Bacteroidales bacterium]|jgi:hypothetical protein|nr:T9SS type A sorting domain-containing protein [Bacteroidales bacterium]MDD2687730.1 T9SS type A sorting domain-containing protein [Bacteroidales bacterium]MDD3329738.1 T9SS type A sorting domain-containing protein [Bacteroidales bacterium]MDD3690472.1 T9SS type A sorting domain-containing protein [Bacteroidales bacterium]MDD4044337.1 T9SS type A sorting domain-containing protein [Bacteroidales bacterium]